MSPSNLNIQYEDDSILVVLKPAGLATQTKQVRSMDLESQVKRYLYKKNPTHEPYLAIIHRLDQPVSGFLVLAKTPQAAKKLNQQLQTTQFKKCYLALLSASPTTTHKKITLQHYLQKDARTNTSHVCTTQSTNAKKAVLTYYTVDLPLHRVATLFPDFYHLNTPTYYPVHIQLQTGRHHQIRTQFSYIGCPILGDFKYGDTLTSHTQNSIALCANYLQFPHPVTGKLMEFHL